MRGVFCQTQEPLPPSPLPSPRPPPLPSSRSPAAASSAAYSRHVRGADVKEIEREIERPPCVRSKCRPLLNPDSTPLSSSSSSASSFSASPLPLHSESPLHTRANLPYPRSMFRHVYVSGHPDPSSLRPPRKSPAGAPRYTASCSARPPSLLPMPCACRGSGEGGEMGGILAQVRVYF